MSIWIIGGTGDSAVLVKAISTVTSCYLVTVVTPEAKSLYPLNTQVLVGRMNQPLMTAFCCNYGVKVVIDASHPFAVEVSQNAIAVARSLNLPYLRYERATINHQSLQLASFDALLQGNYLLNHRVFLTVGCQVLPLFKSWHDRATLFTRILPKVESLQIALDAGFSCDRIMALRPPVTEVLEIALWQQWQINLVVTKASGKSGGEDLKQKVADKLGVQLITIARPPITYPEKTSKIERILEFCQINLSLQ